MRTAWIILVIALAAPLANSASVKRGRQEAADDNARQEPFRPEDLANLGIGTKVEKPNKVKLTIKQAETTAAATTATTTTTTTTTTTESTTQPTQPPPIINEPELPQPTPAPGIIQRVTSFIGNFFGGGGNEFSSNVVLGRKRRADEDKMDKMDKMDMKDMKEDKMVEKKQVDAKPAAVVKQVTTEAPTTSTTTPTTTTTTETTTTTTESTTEAPSNPEPENRGILARISDFFSGGIFKPIVISGRK